MKWVEDTFNKYVSRMLIFTGPNLDKKCIQHSDAAPSYETLEKNLFCCKTFETFKKVSIGGAEILSAHFFVRSALFC